MISRPTALRLALLLLAATADLPAADAVVSRNVSSRWRLQASATSWLGAKVGYGSNPAADPALSPKTDRLYDDGFNRVDSSGNLGDGTATGLATRTGYFGFSADSQVDLKAGTLAMHQLQAAAGDYLAERNPARRPGLDLAVRLSLSRADARRDWGVELGVDFENLKQSSSGPEAANLRILTDTYALGGVVPQRAPYAGRFAPVPGDQRIGDTPGRGLATVAGTADGRRSFAGRVAMVHLGPWLELVPVKLTPPQRELDRWSVDARASLALLCLRGEFQIAEQLRAAGLATASSVTASGSRQRNDLGFLFGVRARRSLGSRWSVIGWADYLAGSKLTVAGTTRYARLDTSAVTRLGLGLEYSPKGDRK